MRQLRLENPPMRGTDVADWQAFLAAQGLLSDPTDGIFGPNTAKASRAWQASHGMPADGVIGPFSLARALEAGLTSADEPLMPGMDASADCTRFVTNIAAAGLKFVTRYYAPNKSKKLTLSEAQALSAAGLQLMTVYQEFNNSIDRFSAAIGTAQASRALQQAAALGQPSSSAIYFSVDFDPSPDDVRGRVMEYFHAVHDAFAVAPYRVGVYGSGLTCRLIRDSGLADLTWLAQSTGFREYRNFLPQADVVQAVPARDLIPRLNIDDDIAQSADFGAFTL